MKFFSKLDEEERGQVGIGTLIIFIALVLVAAVAAGVLINTAGFLQASAESTGTDAQSQVSNQIDVVSASGEVYTATDAESNEVGKAVDEISMIVKKSPGSDPIDLEDATIQYTSGADDVTLTYGDEANHETFTTEPVSGDSATVLSSTGDRVKITISAASISNEGTFDSTATFSSENDLEGLFEDDNATLRIVDQSGATTVYGVNVPHTFGDRTVVAV